jgi:hypothetical protein
MFASPLVLSRRGHVPRSISERKVLRDAFTDRKLVVVLTELEIVNIPTPRLLAGIFHP